MATQGIPMKLRLRVTYPYNIFYTNIKGSNKTPTQINSIDFSDLLCPSLGKLKQCLHLTYMIEVDWLMAQYRSRNLENTPITLLFDRFAPLCTADWCNDLKAPYDPAIDKYPNLTHLQVSPPAYNRKLMKGKHHSRISIFQYADHSIRVAVMGASLWSADWGDYQNMIWVTPPLRHCEDPEGGDSPTEFKATLIKYLSMYKLDILEDWLKIISSANFRYIRTFLVTSYPGKHYPAAQLTHQHRMKNILSRVCEIPFVDEKRNSWELHICVSGIGYFNHSPADWIDPITRVLKNNSSSQHSLHNIPYKLIYPTMKNVASGNGHGFKYEREMHQKQLWLKKYLYQWKANILDRSAAMANCKTYCLINPTENKMAWFLLTSANFSKNGWGYPEGPHGTVHCRTYEVGVLFMPKFFDLTYFKARHSNFDEKCHFPIMYDLPLTPYDEDDLPYCK